MDEAVSATAGTAQEVEATGIIAADCKVRAGYIKAFKKDTSPGADREEQAGRCFSCYFLLPVVTEEVIWSLKGGNDTNGKYTAQKGFKLLVHPAFHI